MIRVKCDDFLRDNDHLYAVKARRKKIVLVRIEMMNPQSSDVHVVLRLTKLTSAGKTFSAETPAVILRQLSEFTWDFFLYPLIDFHPVTAAVEGCLFLTGPLYNRRLKRQLALLSVDDVSLRPGDSKTALIAFRGVSHELERLTVLFRCGGEDQELQCTFNSA